MVPLREFTPNANETLPIDPLRPVVNTVKSTVPNTAVSPDGDAVQVRTPGHRRDRRESRCEASPLCGRPNEIWQMLRGPASVH